MFTVPDIVEHLNYTHSPNYKTRMQDFGTETAHVFRAATHIGVKGIYVLPKANFDPNVVTDIGCVYIAEAQNNQEARRIHQQIWNLGQAPFLIIVLPHEIQVYTGFDYHHNNDQQGLLHTVLASQGEIVLKEILEAFRSYSIESGLIWNSNYAKALNPQQKVDSRLLSNLKKLDEILRAQQLPSDLAHALIGKNVYMRYLVDRGILSDEWLQEQSIQKHAVFGRSATVQQLAQLSKLLDKRFNGRIFPIDFENSPKLSDSHVALTASVFHGDVLVELESQIVQQLHFDFQAYDFKYIPVETLSAIYEQFIDDRKAKGAIYTPEILADYVLAEMHSVSSLSRHTKVLDPACGSGIFLVLAYRRLIEQELGRKNCTYLDAHILTQLLSNFYGVERELDACYVAEFSLILTLLHYSEANELHNNPDFHFPDLHNSHIFHGDFFDDSLPIWKMKPRYDWIVANPPWRSANKSEQSYAYEWIKKQKKQYPTGRHSIAEAFSWRIRGLMSEAGIAGLVMPATSLVNLSSEEFRQKFFSSSRVFRITNFAHIRDELFEGRSALPAASMIYSHGRDVNQDYEIIHVAPHSSHQLPGNTKKVWALTIYENDFQYIPYRAAIKGLTQTWKLALWGTFLDTQILEQIKQTFPHTLEQVCSEWGWGNKHPHEGGQLRFQHVEDNKELSSNPDLANALILDLNTFNKKPRHRFSLPNNRLSYNRNTFIRRKGALEARYAPHMIISAGWDFFIYSDQDFIIPPRQMGIAAPSKDSDKLKALTVYLASSLVRYYLFFHVPEWGMFRDRDSVVVSEVRKIPTPHLTEHQVQRLALLQEHIAGQELKTLQESPEQAYILQQNFQAAIDAEVYSILQIPADIVRVVDDFIRLRLPFDKKTEARVLLQRLPNQDELLRYGTSLRDELNDYSEGIAAYCVELVIYDDMIEAIVEVREADQIYPVAIRHSNQSSAPLQYELWKAAGYQFSHWAYVQRGLHLFEDNRLFLYKSKRLINWTYMQAILDANAIIGQALSTEMR